MENFYSKFSFLKNYKSGHRKFNELTKEEIYENLSSHSNFVKSFYKNFLSKRGINISISFFSQEENVSLNNYLEKFVFFHDLGKLSFKAQKYYETRVKTEDSDHTSISFILTLTYFFDELSLISKKRIRIKNRTKEEIFSQILLVFSFIPTFHHSSLDNFNKKIIETGMNFNFNFQDYILKEIEKKDKIILKIINNYEEIFSLEKYNFLKNGCFKIKNILTKKEVKELFFQIKLFYSCLVLSDYYATFCYQNNKNINDIKIRQIDKDLLKILDKNFHKINYNEKLKNYQTLPIKNLSNCEEINDLRANLIIQASQTLSNNLKENKKVFMLNVPTGGGKTNISLKLALEILKFDSKVNRINWVFPYVNIIEQNTKVIKEHYFDNNEELIKENLSQIYYESIDLDDIDKYTKSESYENSKTDLMEKEFNLNFINNPINIISSVIFFDMLFKVKRKNRYKFANFVNSVIIIDEIQTLSSEHLNLFYQILDILSEQFNMYFIIMSATLPDIKELNKLKENESNAIHLIENYQDYFNHSIFKRNTFEFLEEKFDKEKLIELINSLKKDSNFSKILVVMNTIKSSVEIFKELKSIDDNWNILILNSYVSKNTRNKIISFVKNNEKVILVSTQSVEAGVDLDFDVGIRDKAILDSIEQVAGRVNRECNEEKSKFSKLYVIDYKNESRIYENEIRFKLLKDESFENQISILNNKNFKDYYQKVFQRINKDNQGSITQDYYKYLENLNFSEIGKLEVIKNQISLKLVFNEILTDVREEFKGNIDEFKTVFEILELKKNKDRNFENQPLFKFINTILSKNSISINFFNEEQKENFINFLFDKRYLINFESSLSSKNKKDMFIVNQEFFKNYYENYSIGETNLNYFDIFKLKNEDFKNYDFDNIW